MDNNIIKRRTEESANYSAIWCSGKTLRFAIDPSKPITELKYPEFYDIKVTGNCEGKCPYCFLPGQKVKTICGDENIENIEIGKSVVTYDKKTENVCTSVVDQLHAKKFVGEIFTIELENGTTIKTTPNHLFFTINRGWVKAMSLREDDELFEL